MFFRGKLIIFLFVVGVFLCPHMTQAGVISQPVNSLGLIGYWSFEDNQDTTSVDDYSGNGNTGTMTNMDATPSNDYVAGHKSSSTAMDFDGGDDYVEVANESNFDFERTDPFTFATWIKTTNTANNDFIINKQEDTGSVRGIWFTVDNEAGGGFPGGGVIELGLMNNSSTYSAWHGETSVTDGEWHHVVATSDGTGSDGIRLYVDGMQEATTTIQDGLGANTILSNVPLTIGSRDNGGVPFDGEIDNARVYSRALGAQEIERLYEQHLTFKATDKTNLTGYWSFDEGTSTGVGDFSINSSDGSFTGDPSWVDGRVGTALDLDGGGDAVDVGSSSELDVVMNGVTDMTFTGWYYLKDTSAYRTLFAKGGVGSGVDYSGVMAFTYDTYVRDNGGVGGYTFQIYDGSDSNGFVRAWPDAAFPLNEWVHIAVRYVDTSDINVYVNGELVTGAANFTTGYDESIIDGNYDDALVLGGGFLDNHYWNGYIDDVRVYSGALAETEIKRVFNSSKHTKVNTTQNSKLTNGLIGHWSFNGANLRGTIAEDTAGGNHGTLVGTPLPAQGKVGQGLDFDGSDDYVSLDDTAFPSGDDSRSTSAWFKTDIAQNQVVFTYGTAVSNQEYYVAVYNLGSGCVGDITSTGGNYSVIAGSGGGGSNLCADISVVDGDWHHVATTHDGTTHRIYLDGVLKSSRSQTMNTVANVSYIGVDVNQQGDYDGSIDEVRLYDRALTTLEVQRLYNMGR